MLRTVRHVSASSLTPRSTTERASRFAALAPVFKALRPVMRKVAGTSAFPFWAVIEHRGRRSGRTFRTPVVARRTPDGFVIPLAFGTDVDWCRNVLASGCATLRWSGASHEVSSPEIVDHAAATPAFKGLAAVWLRSADVHSFLRIRAAPR